MAPTRLRRRFLQLIDRERRRAEAGQPAEIIAKMNSLIDEEIIGRFTPRRSAGVRIRLNVRGICALRPGVPASSDNIEVVSIVDRFLEHSRIYYFLNGGDDRSLSRERRLDDPQPRQARRADVPDRGPGHKATVLQALRAMFRDTVKARWLNADGTYRRRKVAEEPKASRLCRAQETLYDQARRAAALARQTEPA